MWFLDLKWKFNKTLLETFFFIYYFIGLVDKRKYFNAWITAKLKGFKGDLVILLILDLKISLIF